MDTKKTGKTKDIEKTEKVRSISEFKRKYFPSILDTRELEDVRDAEEVGKQIGKRAAGQAQLFSATKK